MKFATLILCLIGSLGFGTASAQELEELWFRPSDTLAQRDEYGLLHSSTVIYPTDLEPRYHWRPLYYLEGEHDVARMPAYVGALQVALTRLGYYRGPIDGIMGPGTSYAIRAYERDHGLRMDGVISGQLIRNMGLRY